MDIIGYHPEELVGQSSEFASKTIFSQSGKFTDVNEVFQ